MNTVDQVKRNVDLDDWCGPELLTAKDGVARATCDDAAVVNHVFLGAFLDRMLSYTLFLLFTFDRFADRNRRMAADGFPSPGWNSVSPADEAFGLQRAARSLNGRPRPAFNVRLRLRNPPQ